MLRIFCLSLLMLVAPAHAEYEWLIQAGGGPQPGASQRNQGHGVDLLFGHYHRSSRQRLSLGVGYTSLTTSAEPDKQLQVISVFPQLTLFGTEWHGAQPFFFVRALGPSWLSEKQLGSRQQGKHLAFQAQVGGGIYLGRNRNWHLSLAYKHFSNANLFSPNDGIDLPLSVALGYRW